MDFGLEAESDVELARSALELRLVLAKVFRIEVLVFGRAGAILVSQTHHLPVEAYAERIVCSETPQHLCGTCHLLAVLLLFFILVTVHILVVRHEEEGTSESDVPIYVHLDIVELLVVQCRERCDGIRGTDTKTDVSLHLLQVPRGLVVIAVLVRAVVAVSVGVALALEVVDVNVEARYVNRRALKKVAF